MKGQTIVFWAESGQKKLQVFDTPLKANQHKRRLVERGITKFTTARTAPGAFINTKSHLATTQTAL